MRTEFELLDGLGLMPGNRHVVAQPDREAQRTHVRGRGAHPRRARSTSRCRARRRCCLRATAGVPLIHDDVRDPAAKAIRVGRAAYRTRGVPEAKQASKKARAPMNLNDRLNVASRRAPGRTPATRRLDRTTRRSAAAEAGRLRTLNRDGASIESSDGRCAVRCTPRPAAALRPASPEPAAGARPARRRSRRRRPRSSSRRIGTRLNDPTLTEEQLHSLARAELAEIVAAEQLALSTAERNRLIDDIGADVLGYGPLEPLLDDPTVSEIMVNRFDQLYVERNGRLTETPHRFTGEPQLRRVIERIVVARRPPHRRVVAAGRRPPRGRLARQRDHPAARGQRLVAHDPQVRGHAVHESRTSSASAR